VVVVMHLLGCPKGTSLHPLAAVNEKGDVTTRPWLVGRRDILAKHNAATPQSKKCNPSFGD
jgi:hypothetical protein